ncbi:uncharacterized protein LOC119449020 [Dermacentor silvarum]|uniref:uncharacterized protein LOC119449020 n=1 Tax=Dermacentor silvarum TaxID=543639 RepID=UPI001899F94E|nr:uncharacterized protein LOC119449020 [Dermacentor silvarum]
MFEPTSVDASALLSHSGQGQGHVINCTSALLSPSEHKFSISDHECLGLAWPVAKFRPYLSGGSYSVITGHHALWLLSPLIDPTERFGGWTLKLQELDALYKSGAMNQDPDYLSHHPVGPFDTTVHDSDTSVLAISDLSDIQKQQ